MTEAQWAEVQAATRWWKEFRRAWKSIGADFANREKLSPSPPPVLATLADLDVPSVIDVSAYDVERSCGGKRRYSTEQQANAVAVRCFHARGVSLRVYACTLCGAFHVTKHNAEPMMREGWRPPRVSERQQNHERKRRRARR